MSFCTTDPVNKLAKPYNPMSESHSYHETIFTFPVIRYKIKEKNLFCSYGM